MLKKRLEKMGLDPTNHRQKLESDSNSKLSGTQKSGISNLCHFAQWESARLEAEARLARESKMRANGTWVDLKVNSSIVSDTSLLNSEDPQQSSARSLSPIPHDDSSTEALHLLSSSSKLETMFQDRLHNGLQIIAPSAGCQASAPLSSQIVELGSVKYSNLYSADPICNRITSNPTGVPWNLPELLCKNRAFTTKSLPACPKGGRPDLLHAAAKLHQSHDPFVPTKNVQNSPTIKSGDQPVVNNLQKSADLFSDLHDLFYGDDNASIERPVRDSSFRYQQIMQVTDSDITEKDGNKLLQNEEHLETISNLLQGAPDPLSNPGLKQTACHMGTLFQAIPDQLQQRNCSRKIISEPQQSAALNTHFASFCDSISEDNSTTHWQSLLAQIWDGDLGIGT